MGERVTRGLVGGWWRVAGGGVSEYFRNVGAAVARGLCAGCRLLRLWAWGWSIPLPAREWFPTRCPFALGDLPKKPIPQIHPLLRFLLGMEKVSCPTFDAPEWPSLVRVSVLLPSAIGFAHHGEVLGFSGMKVISCGPKRSPERPRIAGCGKHEKSLLI